MKVQFYPNPHAAFKRGDIVVGELMGDPIYLVNEKYTDSPDCSLHYVTVLWDGKGKAGQHKEHVDLSRYELAGANRVTTIGGQFSDVVVSNTPDFEGYYLLSHTHTPTGVNMSRESNTTMWATVIYERENGDDTCRSGERIVEDICRFHRYDGTINLSN